MKLAILFAVIAFCLSAIPISMLLHRIEKGTWKGFWS